MASNAKKPVVAITRWRLARWRDTRRGPGPAWNWRYDADLPDGTMLHGIERLTSITSETNFGIAEQNVRMLSEVFENGLALTPTAIVHCECGDITGVRCEWHGPETETVEVEYMPPYLRGSHEACGSKGWYPSNGAERITCERSCAEQLVRDDPEWVSIV